MQSLVPHPSRSCASLKKFLVASFFFVGFSSMVGCGDAGPTAPDSDEITEYASGLNEEYDSGATLDSSDELAQ